MRAGLTTLQIMEDEGLLANAETIGTFMMNALRAALKDCPGVVEVRGRGLMIGIELQHPCPHLVTQALEAGLVINVTAERVVRLLPPLIFNHDHANQLVETLVPLVRKTAQSAP